MWETEAYIAQPTVLTAKTDKKIIVWTLSSDLVTILPEKSYIPTQYLGDGSPDEDAYHLINFFDSQEQKNLGTYYFDEMMSSIEDKVLRKTDARNQIIMVDTITMRKVAEKLKEIDMEALALLQ